MLIPRSVFATSDQVMGEFWTFSGTEALSTFLVWNRVSSFQKKINSLSSVGRGNRCHSKTNVLAPFFWSGSSHTSMRMPQEFNSSMKRAGFWKSGAISSCLAFLSATTTDFKEVKRNFYRPLQLLKIGKKFYRNGIMTDPEFLGCFFITLVGRMEDASVISTLEASFSHVKAGFAIRRTSFDAGLMERVFKRRFLCLE